MRENPGLLGRAALACVVALGLPVGAAATSLRSVSMAEMLERAALVFEGRAVAERTVDDEGGIRTCVDFEVIEVLKGAPLASPLELCFAGGTSGGVKRAVHGMIQPRSGEHGVYFVTSLEGQRPNPFYGWHQGHFVVGKDGMRTADGRALAGLEPTGHEGAPARGAARGARVTDEGTGIALDAFKAELRSRLAEGR